MGHGRTSQYPISEEGNVSVHVRPANSPEEIQMHLLELDLFEPDVEKVVCDVRGRRCARCCLLRLLPSLCRWPLDADRAVQSEGSCATATVPSSALFRA